MSKTWLSFRVFIREGQTQQYCHTLTPLYLEVWRPLMADKPNAHPSMHGVRKPNMKYMSSPIVMSQLLLNLLDHNGREFSLRMLSDFLVEVICSTISSLHGCGLHDKVELCSWWWMRVLVVSFSCISSLWMNIDI